MVRLSRSPSPANYTVDITPDFDGCRFVGTCTVVLAVAEPLTRLTCHGKDLAISAVQVAALGDTDAATTLSLAADAVSVDADLELVTVTLGAVPLPAGRYAVTYSYTAAITDDMSGFYRSRYTTADGSTAFLYSTQFETTFARRVFPCWDEPSFKVGPSQPARDSHPSIFVFCLSVGHTHTPFLFPDSRVDAQRSNGNT